MHLHFVQSLEPLQGAGLGQAALSLHLAMRGKSLQCSVFSFQEDTSALPGPRPTTHASSPHAPRPVEGEAYSTGPSSMLLATRDAKFTREWPDVIQGVRKGPARMLYAPEFKRLAAEAVEQAEWFHGYRLYVWTNMWLGASDHAFLKTEI